MKRFLPLLSLLTLLATSITAQELRYGITAALNISNYSIDQSGITYNANSRTGFKAGFRMEIDAPFITEGFYFDMEALLSSRGATIQQIYADNYFSNTFRPYYLEIPIHAGYRYDFGKDLGLFASFGPYFDIGLFGKNKFFNGVATSKPDTFAGSGIKRFDFGLGLRGGVQFFEHYRIFVGYDWGLVDIARKAENDSAYNRNFYIGASYMF